MHVETVSWKIRKQYLFFTTNVFTEINDAERFTMEMPIQSQRRDLEGGRQEIYYPLGVTDSGVRFEIYSRADAIIVILDLKISGKQS